MVSDRCGSSQVWLIDPDGANPRQATEGFHRGRRPLVSPDGKQLVFTSEVYPECGADDACNTRKLVEEKSGKVQARIYTALLYRHWTHWQGNRRSHILVSPLAGGPARDLTPGSRDVPPFSLGGADDYAVSPDNTELCFSMNRRPGARGQHQLRALRRSHRPAASRAKSLSPPAPTATRATLPTANTSPGAPRFAPDMRATAGA